MESPRETSRLSAAEIFDRVETGANEELERPAHNLAISAVAAGLTMGLSGLGVAVLHDQLGHGSAATAVAYLTYPLGFLIVIIGRQQLFTENTLFPVALVLVRRECLASTARLWGIVLTGNALGATLFALLATKTPAVSGSLRTELVDLGVEVGSKGLATVFWTAVVAGWLIALVAWLVTASTDTVGQILIIFFLTYIVGVAGFAHSIAGMAEVLSSAFGRGLSLGTSVLWVVVAVLGNAVGGVVIVALLNYGQVHQNGD